MEPSLQNVTELIYIKKMEAQVFWHFEKLFQDISRLSSFIFVFLHSRTVISTTLVWRGRRQKCKIHKNTL